MTENDRDRATLHSAQGAAYNAVDQMHGTAGAVFLRHLVTKFFAALFRMLDRIEQLERRT